MTKIDFGSLQSLDPVSKIFALDRGTPIDRVYIEDFLIGNSNLIQGNVLEIADSTYSKKFGENISNYGVLSEVKSNNIGIVGDLTNVNTLPSEEIDCFICTQTLNFIYEFKKAIYGIYHTLKKNGSALVTVAGISQISRYDMDRWGDYWRFTDLSMKKVFGEVFGDKNVKVEFYGNVLAATAFIQGVSAEELTKEELFYKDEDYQVTIVVRATKR